MDHQRREALRAAGGLGLFALLAAAGLIGPELAQAAQNRAGFEAHTLEAALSALGAGKPAASTDIELNVPDLNENGAAVRLGIVSRLPKTEQIAILIEKNPNLLAAHFTLPEGTVADLQAEVKMSQSSDIHVLVKADGRFYAIRKEVKVTIGGCGA
ncbi:thiosulfate oxidation carrier protein SoxY [Thauera sinica]|uniref:Thiosulfate oxidation carrier protein SoxY n=1 Tax=Thauera sinica TaxID=2665146 RepID=A0ABW1ALP8_9RHOO|nr:thiosulfate oxidation carrier protein SoxY [Thauera sp. K11]ATE60744.1 thiosulfate oxidation carrier protein SoxY [Thauera sp. K11]